MPLGHEPMPSPWAASIMFCAARPASKPVGPLPRTTIATASAAPRRFSGCHTVSAARASASSRRTMKRRACRLRELPASAAGLQQAPDGVVGQRAVGVGAHLALAHDGQVDIHN